MEICARCGAEFDVTSARRSIGRMYGTGVYNDFYPEEYVCKHCAAWEMVHDYAQDEEQEKTPEMPTK